MPRATRLYTFYRTHLSERYPMPKRVTIAIDFDYDRDHTNDLLDVVQVSQVHSDLSNDEAHEQVEFLFKDLDWFLSFATAVSNALTGAPTHFGSEDN
jgi:hypothetical protein